MEADTEPSRVSYESMSPRSASFGDESSTRLLEKGASHDGLDDNWRKRDLGRTPRLTSLSWKLVLFLVICTASLLAFVKLSISTERNQSQNLDPATLGSDWRRDADDYVLSHGWDFRAAPQVREYSWTIEDAVINPDGVYRSMMVINRQFPGPLLRVNEGDTIQVTVHNKAANATSIHWHGMYQNGTNHMDGTIGVTQCPIAPGHSMVYKYKVEGQSGTYWYHGHHGVQTSDGLFGPLVVHSKDEHILMGHDYVTDRIVMITDHYHDSSKILTQRYLSPDQENAEPIPDGALINGRNFRDCSRSPERKCDSSSSGTTAMQLEPNAKHRLRIINAGALAEFQFQVDEHELAVIEVDGTDVHPKSYHRLNINPAQRYSVILSANVSTSAAFIMRARMITTCFAEPKASLDPDVNVVIRYAGTDPSVVPTSKDWGDALALECRDMNTTDLHPVKQVRAPTKVDAFYYLRSNFEIGAHRLSRGFFNTSSFRPNHRSPSLYRTLDGLAASNGSFLSSSTASDEPSAFVNSAAFDARKELVVQTSGIQVVDLMIHNFDDGNHPMHLHGYNFFVLAQGHGAPPTLDRFRGPDRENVQPLYDSLDLSNPLRRDTASVEAYGWILLRVVFDNPGMWAFHCHISWHTEAGLLMQFLTRTDELRHLRVPGEQRALCQAPGAGLGKGPSDQEYYDNDQK